MLWLTWRQYRGQFLATAALLLLLGAVFLISGVEATVNVLRDAPPGCPGPGAGCRDVNLALSERYQLVYQGFGLLPLVGPALVGAFWGAPLIAREYERGTQRLAWTQSVPLRRWLLVKLAVLVAAVALGGLMFSAMTSLWLPIFAAVQPGSFASPDTFNATGVAPAAWWVFAFLLGAAASAVLRRTLPAMAATVAVVALTVPVLVLTQGWYAEPMRAVVSGTDELVRQNALLTGEAWVDGTGREIGGRPEETCPPAPGVDVSTPERAQRATAACMTQRGYQYVVFYHPADRFWRFQLFQTAILLGGGAAFAFATMAFAWRRRT
ncbi:hypothetical protein AB0H57_19775 [Micromonospora sp. NPDC050686]|uniref:hypothetical protein n=1 Tax=Micromonospora sp. NPDC050686 TaxID=3154631 RepID=UPI0034112BF4